MPIMPAVRAPLTLRPSSALHKPLAALRIFLLTFTSLGWRLPVRLHMPLQAIKIGLMMTFGTHPYCRSKVGWDGRVCRATDLPVANLPPPPSLHAPHPNHTHWLLFGNSNPCAQLLNSPQFDSITTSLHATMAIVAVPLMPLNSTIFLPQGQSARCAFAAYCHTPFMASTHYRSHPLTHPTTDFHADLYAQRVTMLLLCWLVLGWVFPTVLLLPMTEVREAAEARPAALVERLIAGVEQTLADLLPRRHNGTAASMASRLKHRRGMPATLLLLLLHWWVLLVGLWCGCCFVAPMFVPPA